MKQKILLLMFLLGSIAVYAGETMPCLVIQHRDGSQTTLAMSSSPVITFSGTDMKVQASGAEYVIAIADVAQYGVSENTPVAVAPLGGATARPVIANGRAIFSGLKAGAAVTVYSLDGKTLLQTKATADGVATIDVRKLGQGVFVLKSPSASFKVTNSK